MAGRPLKGTARRFSLITSGLREAFFRHDGLEREEERRLRRMQPGNISSPKISRFALEESGHVMILTNNNHPMPVLYQHQRRPAHQHKYSQVLLQIFLQTFLGRL